MRDIERVTRPDSHARAQSPPMYTAPPSLWTTSGLSAVGRTALTRSSSMPTMRALSGRRESLQHTGQPSKQSMAGDR